MTASHRALRRRLYIAFGGAGVVAMALAAAPFVFVLLDEPSSRTQFWVSYPALFLFILPFFPAAIVSLAPPTVALIEDLLADRSRRRRLWTACLGASFLIALPAYAVISERYKVWVAPWEVVRDEQFSTVERFTVPEEAKRAAMEDGATWMRSSRWPAAFFFLRDTREAKDAATLSARTLLQRSYRILFTNRNVLSGRLKTSRAGQWHYGAVAAVAFVAALLLMEVVVVFTTREREPDLQLPPRIFRALVAALSCFVFFVLMRLVTLQVDRAVFGESSAYEQVIPVVFLTGSALLLLLSGLRKKAREEWIAVGTLVGGPLALFGSLFAPDTVAAVFSDLRTYGASLLLLPLVLIFLVGSGGDSVNERTSTRAPPVGG